MWFNLFKIFILKDSLTYFISRYSQKSLCNTIAGVLTFALLIAWENPTIRATEVPEQTSFLTYLRGQKETHRIVSSPTKKNGDNGIHRHLNFMDIMDIKTIVEKDESPSAVEWKYPMDPTSFPRQISVLALGGGYCAEYFSFLLGTPNVDLITNDRYPSMCADSTLPDVGKKNYDVILMINHERLEGFPTLLLCCKHRYPESVIVFVRTWNLNMLVQVEGNSSELVEVNIAPPIEAIWTTGQGGHIYQMPLPNSVEEAMEWFSGNICFSSKGNQIVANGILQLLSTHEDEVFQPKQLGAFMPISEHGLHHASKSCFWTPGDSESCREMLYTRIPSISPGIRWFFIGDSTQRILYYSSININSTYVRNLFTTNDGEVDKFMETQSCRNGDLCVCVVNSGFHDMRILDLTDEMYIYNLREYLQLLQPFCRHLVWIPTTSVLELPNWPQRNSRSKIWNAMVAEMLNSQPFVDWTSWIDTYKGPTMMFHYDNVHLESAYYNALGDLFRQVDMMISEKYTY